MTDDCIPTHYGPQDRPVTIDTRYQTKVLVTEPIAYWPLSEASGTIAECLVDPLQNGEAVSLTWADNANAVTGTAAPYFDGINDLVDIGNLTFRAAFQAAAEAGAFSIGVWCRVSAAGVWTDGFERDAIRILRTGNFIYLRKPTVNNLVQIDYQAAALFDRVSNTPYSPTAWFYQMVTIDQAADEMRGYWNGAQVGGTQTGIGLWAGAPSTNTMAIGAAQVSPAALLWHGWLQHCAVWDRALTPTEAAYLAVAV